MNPIWSVADQGLPPHAALQGERDVDTVIVGGGVTGLSAALKLVEAGQRVAVLEAHRVGAGSSGRSTGNLYGTTSQHLASVQKKHGDGVLANIVQMRMRAITDIEKTIEKHALACDFSRRPMYLCARSPDSSHQQSLQAELCASLAAGLAAEAVDLVPDFPVQLSGAVKLEYQAQYNPKSYVLELASLITKLGGLIFENTKVVDVSAGDGRVTTEDGVIRARDIVFATHTPKGINILQAEMEAYQEYGVAAELRDTDVREGIYWIRDDAVSVRIYTHAAKRYLVVVGGKHKTGRGDKGIAYYDSLKRYASTYFPVKNFTHQWSAQQYTPADQLPYIGRSGHNNVFVGTGYAADGLTWGAVAANIISQAVLGVADASAADLLNPRRFAPLKSAKSWLRENASVAKHLMEGHLGSHDQNAFEDVAAGEGKVIERDGKKLAVSRGLDNELTVVSAICPHMKCLVNWNSADATWDCPCHGSRFTAQGAVIEGPAYEGLTGVQGYSPER